MPKYRYTGTHADEIAIGDKIVPVAPGDFVTLSADDYKAATDKDLSLIEVKKDKEGSDK